jgi:hypothetical protein
VPHAPPNPVFWKGVWKIKSLPKVDMFVWTLSHGSILTRENLKKRGLAGPSNFPLCISSKETYDHLFLGCPFEKEV